MCTDQRSLASAFSVPENANIHVVLGQRSCRTKSDRLPLSKDDRLRTFVICECCRTARALTASSSGNRKRSSGTSRTPRSECRTPSRKSAYWGGADQFSYGQSPRLFKTRSAAQSGRRRDFVIRSERRRARPVQATLLHPSGDLMLLYIDAIVVPVSRADLDTCIGLAAGH